jgi:6-pyruvoyltetrahydropterin/6-carboxytetrahydropterin synthase
MIHVTRQYSFSASHRLHSPALSDQQNSDLFGKCNNPYGHGHNYELFVTVSGEVDRVTGLAIDRERLDTLVRQTVLQRVDHKDFNRDVPEFQGHLIPTTENVNSEIFRWLADAWSSQFPGDVARLEKVRIAETARNIFA